MLNIIIKTTPHQEQRYPTIGDWFYKNNGEELHIRVSCMNDWHKEICVAVHELVEALLCKDRGITQREIDIFDMEFEAKREKGNTDEPGEDPYSPYYNEHFFATNIERLLVAEFGLKWRNYEETINSL